MGHPLAVPSGDEIMGQLQGFTERPRLEGKGWKKRSIFFTLPYWKDNELRLNLDVMHIEKNVVNNIIGTLLDIKGKTKDNHEAHQDLRKLGLRPGLHPFIADNNKTYLPSANFTMTKTEKYGFLKVISDVRVPNRYASNVSRCVKLKECSIGGMKSHDSHILMQQFMPIALRRSLPNMVVGPLIELCGFFKEIYSKTLRIEYLNRLESQIPIILCNLEQIFPLGFFTISVHLVMHLVRECKLGGPVHYRWMYPIERYYYSKIMKFFFYTKFIFFK
jgi:hypothetical protein